MLKKKWTSPHKKQYAFAKRSAVIQNRIMALFLSTKFSAIYVKVAIYTVFLPFGVLIFRQTRHFLFSFAADKPGYIQPGCRSPPASDFNLDKQHQI